MSRPTAPAALATSRRAVDPPPALRPSRPASTRCAVIGFWLAHCFRRPEMLDVVDLPDPVPARGEVLLDISSVGVNHADTHHRLS